MNNDNKLSLLLNVPEDGKKQSVYFLGIGGIGMSALARYFSGKGFEVSGYDKTKTALTNKLISEGIKIHFFDEVELADKNAGLVVYTPAIPDDHSELNFFRKNKYQLCKRSEVLAMITENSFAVCVAGTHGKTTTSAMLAHILRDSGFGCNAFLGGIATNYNTNFWSDPNNITVAEADEYDRSFLKLNPDIAIITSMDADHLDIYGTAEKMEDAFISFSQKIKQDGLLIYKHGLKRGSELKASQMISYSIGDEDADARAVGISISGGSYNFDVKIKNKTVQDVTLHMGGRHNIENAVACIAVANQLKISDEAIKKAVASFEGVKRRFEYIVRTGSQVIIDDYAHHPEELNALIESAKELYPGMKCTIVFQPHLFTRTRDLASGFGKVLSKADEVFLLPIYPAREKPIPGVSSELIIGQMGSIKKQVIKKEDLLTRLEQTRPPLLLIAGAGDVDTMVDHIKNIMQ